MRSNGSAASVAFPPPRRWPSRVHAWAWLTSGIGLLAFGGWLGFATFQEVRLLARVMHPTPPEVVDDLFVRNAPDSMGRRASFRILLFTDEFRWRLSSFDSLEDGSEKPEFTPEMKAVLNDAEEIISVGASSEEVPPGVSFEAGRAFEERRAARRAEQIAVWVRSALSSPIPIRKLNVGHHAPTEGESDTSDQRRVVIILVLDRDEGADIDQALRTAMTREIARAPIFETLLTQYSLVSGRTFEWVP